MYPPPTRGRLVKTLLTPLIALLLAMSLVACENNDDTVVEDAEEEGTAASLVGTEVTVSGEITAVVPPSAFIISGDDASFGVDEGTLVYGADGEEYAEVVDGTYVQATGTVREFLITDVESTLGIDYDDALLTPFEEEFAVEASSLEVIPERGVIGDDTVLSEAEEDGTAESMVGQTLTVAGEVEEVIDANAFRIQGDETGEGTLVFHSTDAAVADETIVEVTGTVVEYVLADIESELGVDLDDDLYLDLTDEFALVASGVETVPSG